jgi:hypothetical protein
VRLPTGWFAAGTGGSDLPLSGFAQYGFSGLILSVALWFFWAVYKRERDRADSNATEIKRLNDLIQDKYVPSLERATVALKESTDALAVARDKRRP